MGRCIQCGDTLPPLNGVEENDFAYECQCCDEVDYGDECKHEEAYTRSTYIGGVWTGSVSYCRDCDWSEVRKPTEQQEPLTGQQG